jgi:hypothetical protein
MVGPTIYPELLMAVTCHAWLHLTEPVLLLLYVVPGCIVAPKLKALGAVRSTFPVTVPVIVVLPVVAASVGMLTDTAIASAKIRLSIITVLFILFSSLYYLKFL